MYHTKNESLGKLWVSGDYDVWMKAHQLVITRAPLWGAGGAGLGEADNHGCSAWVEAEDHGNSLSLPLNFAVNLKLLYKNKIFLKNWFWVPGWLSQLSVLLQLRSWSHGSWVQPPCRALCWQLRAGACFRFCVSSLSFCPCPTCALSLFLNNK